MVFMLGIFDLKITEIIGSSDSRVNFALTINKKQLLQKLLFLPMIQNSY